MCHMRVISLQSGSNGNCVYVEAGDVKLLFDAGISGKQAKERLSLYGLDVAAVDAVLISHDHVDHSRGMGVFNRKFGLPIYATAKTHRAAGRNNRGKLGSICDLRHFSAGDTLHFGRVSVETISTPHDGADGVAFIVDDGRRRLGVMTDLGHVFSDLIDAVAALDAVVLESNYDPDMLADGPYPEHLKERIAGPSGHLSNVEAAQVLRSSGLKRLQWACLAHLSEDNNTPQLAVKTHRRILGRRMPISVASRYEPSEPMSVR